MGFMENIFGKDKDKDKEIPGRENLGGSSQAIPKQPNLDTTDEEADQLAAKRLKIEKLGQKIAEIENNPDHTEYSKLEEMRGELRSLEGGQ